MKRTHTEKSRRKVKRTWRDKSTRGKPSANMLKTEHYQNVLKKLAAEDKK
jgi:hypothetical protein